MPDHSVYVALDFETSGYRGDRACALGMTKLVDGEIVAEYYTLIRPPSSRVYFTDVHGLTWRDLKDQRPFGEIWPEIWQFLADAQFLIAHNARFDMNVLGESCRANRLAMPSQPFLCTLRGARRALRLKSYSLNVVAPHFGITLRHHHAGSDAQACGLIHARLRQAGLANAAMLLN